MGQCMKPQWYSISFWYLGTMAWTWRRSGATEDFSELNSHEGLWSTRIVVYLLLLQCCWWSSSPIGIAFSLDISLRYWLSWLYPWDIKVDFFLPIGDWDCLHLAIEQLRTLVGQSPLSFPRLLFLFMSSHCSTGSMRAFSLSSVDEDLWLWMSYPRRRFVRHLSLILGNH